MEHHHYHTLSDIELYRSSRDIANTVDRHYVLFIGLLPYADATVAAVGRTHNTRLRDLPNPRFRS